MQLQGRRALLVQIARDILDAAGAPDRLSSDEADFERVLFAVRNWRSCAQRYRGPDVSGRASEHICRKFGVNYHRFKLWRIKYEAFEEQACDQRIVCALKREAA